MSERSEVHHGWIMAGLGIIIGILLTLCFTT